MKQDLKKPRSPAKKKRRRKPVAADKFRALIIAAVLIVATGILSLGAMYLRTATHEAKAAPEINSTVPPVIAELSPEKAAPAPVAPEPSAPGPSAPAALEPSTPAQPASATPRPSAPVQPAPVTVQAVSTTVIERPASRGKLAFVIDDAGYNLHELEPFLKLSEPLTIAVLPGLAYSAEAARRIRAAGKEVFLHQPMEALGGQNPGPNAIKAGMDKDEIRSIIIRNLDEVGPVAGINNHEGSRITMDENAMETILALCRERGLLFLDSRTTADTAAPGAARRLGINIAERDVFVDNVQSRESMIAYINTGLTRAEQKGQAILIGHVWSPELAPLLASLSSELRERGYSFSAVSKL